MAYQTMPEPYLTGPWHAERMWHLHDSVQPAWIVPPVGHLGSGPSGFAYYPGVGLGDEFRDRFFLCNVVGNKEGVETFGVTAQGAGFRKVDQADFLKPLMATDIDFGTDGRVYVADHHQLEWNGPSGWGRIRFTIHSRPSTQLYSNLSKFCRQILASVLTRS
jgi:quinoprotein glucose dehydrogenase